MSKVKININGVEEEVDLDNLDELKKYGIHVNENNEYFNEDDKDNIKKLKNMISKKHGLKAKIIEATPLLSLIAFLLLGFLGGYWHPGWIVFLAIPLVPTLLNLFSGTKGAIMSSLTLLIIVGYVVCGCIWSLWHPYWIVFLLIPVIGIFIKK